MSAEENRAIVRRWYEEFGNRANLDVLDELYAPSWVGHFPRSGDLRGAADHKPIGRMFATAFPDGRYEVADLVTENDRVASRYVFRGTHQGELLGIAPTGRPVAIGGINVHRLADGRIAEQWTQLDTLGLLQQFGVMPGGGQGTPETPADQANQQADADAPSPEENKALVRRFWEEEAHRRNPTAIEEMVAPDYVGHFPPTPDLRGPDALRQFNAETYRAFPDAHFAIDDLFGERDRVALRWTLRGTHQGELRGGIAATGRRVEVGGINIFRLAGGRIAEVWSANDTLGLLQQLGLVPAPG